MGACVMNLKRRVFALVVVSFSIISLSISGCYGPGPDVPEPDGYCDASDGGVLDCPPCRIFYMLICIGCPIAEYTGKKF